MTQLPSSLRVALAAVAATLTFPAAAAAQGYAPPSHAPPGYAPPPAAEPAPAAPIYPAANLRRGITFGIGAGVGGMESNDGPIECFDCEDSVAGSIDAHIGYMINPRLALGFEVWGTGQALDSEASATLVQVLALGTVRLWLQPRLWVKAGIGSAHLSMSYADSDEPTELDTGAAVMGAVGVELIHRPRFALDLQLRGGAGNYEGIQDRVSQGMLELGLSWF
jgi:hypothetical protein